MIPADAGPRMMVPNGGVVYSYRPPGQQRFKSQSDFVAVMLSPSPGIRSAFASDRLKAFDAPAGMLVVSPSEVESATEWTNARENIVVSFEPGQLEQLAAHEFDRGLPELTPLPFPTVDQTALRIAQALQSELSHAERANSLVVDALLTVLGVSILRKYVGSRFTTARAGLSPYKRRLLDDFIRSHLGHKLKVAELAKLCDMAPSSFMRAFAESYGEPPHQHILRLRLDMAEALLHTPELSIAQIAYATGFSSQSHFTSTMRKHRGVTPAMLRLNR
ncbi:MAG TPA: AraC family transcriptional regulator [Devosia sp.]|uniref:helix-turn-helix transcriptional regulator n=1 Tax=Devosia sp. TaxID=1871048 RepID=UPI002F921812